jgi:cytochrome c biogenesis protein CcmG/thiol:disulfide interchange protein DsbE
VLARNDDDSTGSQPSVTTDGPLAGLPTSQAVTITGDALPEFAGEATVDPAVGLPAPVLDGADFNGRSIRVDAAGGAHLLVFLAHWCPHCNAEMGQLIDWKHSGAVPSDLHVLAVATAVSPTSLNYPPAQWFSERGWPWPVLVDQSTGDGTPGRVARAFGGTAWPYFVVVGADGLVKVRVAGEVDPAAMATIVADALAG